MDGGSKGRDVDEAKIFFGYEITGDAAIMDDRKNQAGEGNRTLVSSLGSYSSAIELHPRREGDVSDARGGHATTTERRLNVFLGHA